MTKYKNVFSLLFPNAVNAKNEAGETLLHIAVKQSNELAVKFLLDHQADPNQEDNKKLATLFYACGSFKIAALLREYGAQY